MFWSLQLEENKENYPQNIYVTVLKNKQSDMLN